MKLTQFDQSCLEKALDEAKKSAVLNEAPIGVVIVHGDEVIASAHNLKEKTKDATSHAEVNAIKKASEKLGDWRLTECTLYSTLEPCPMCMGVILHSRIKRLVYMALDYRWGACGSVVDLSKKGLFNHTVEVLYSPDKRSSELLSTFFKQKRKR